MFSALGIRNVDLGVAPKKVVIDPHTRDKFWLCCSVNTHITVYNPSSQEVDPPQPDSPVDNVRAEAEMENAAKATTGCFQRWCSWCCIRAQQAGSPQELAQRMLQPFAIFLEEEVGKEVADTILHSHENKELTSTAIRLMLQGVAAHQQQVKEMQETSSSSSSTNPVKLTVSSGGKRVVLVRKQSTNNSSTE